MSATAQCLVLNNYALQCTITIFSNAQQPYSKHGNQRGEKRSREPIVKVMAKFMARYLRPRQKAMKASAVEMDIAGRCKSCCDNDAVRTVHVVKLTLWRWWSGWLIHAGLCRKGEDGMTARFRSVHRSKGRSYGML